MPCHTFSLGYFYCEAVWKKNGRYCSCLLQSKLRTVKPICLPVFSLILLDCELYKSGSPTIAHYYEERGEKDYTKIS